LARRLSRAASMVNPETARIRDAVLRLPIAERDVLLLSRFGGKSYEQIAEICGQPVEEIEQLLAHALALCVAEFGRSAAEMERSPVGARQVSYLDER